MITPLRQYRPLLDGPRHLHEQQRGAIAILAMAGAMILLLASWTVYDTGSAAQKKMDAQIAADTAALSQATVKARSMNLLAYANVTKRSVWGIHTLYPSYMSAVAQWIHGDYSLGGFDFESFTGMNAICTACYATSGEDGSNNELCNLCNYMNNNRVMWKNVACKENDFETACSSSDPDSWGDFYRFSGHDHNTETHELMETEQGSEYPKLIETDLEKKLRDGRESGAPAPYTFRVGEDPSWSKNFFGKDLIAIDNYQRFITAITPWWGWTEQSLRAVRNGATLSGSFPTPPGVLPDSTRRITETLIDHFSDATPVGSAETIHNHSSYVDGLPVRPGNIGTMKSHLASAVSAGNIFNVLKACLDGGNCATENPFLLEHMLNIASFLLNSEGTVVGFSGDGALEFASSVLVHLLGSLETFRTRGLQFTQNSMVQSMGANRIAAEPWELRPFRNTGEWQLQTSNLVLAMVADFTSFSILQGRKKYELLNSDYMHNDAKSVRYRNHFYAESFADRPTPIDPTAINEKNTYRAASTWAMSRAEIFHTGADGPDLWTPSWTSRMRPIVIGNEWHLAGYNMNQVYHDTLPYMVLSRTIGATGQWPLNQVGVDMLRMEKISHSMGPSTIGGLTK
ncbi:hypothetical protein DL240_02015 [Lujinxingia litoralis]|uniref:Uncharacterized protein n=1 Tax=Lujinxingia litoralis TaxID=2211119 RepID=A0A328CCN9_9DELT|nr:Tad domain-containing protein [Lujinxingia litoralis]RAL25011.1 hypothetical protein DL240_02015 [Lujinxingia litoralis]